ncbi:peptidoglycan-binding protein [Streptomyces sp. NPDC102278]|uniref:peptidoglycan-binding domain-containing protein n=1 Tax=Streptomyces sp. NPDC102278 TaxID=3366152 RepID=UPI00382A1FBB
MTPQGDGTDRRIPGPSVHLRPPAAQLAVPNAGDTTRLRAAALRLSLRPRAAFQRARRGHEPRALGASRRLTLPLLATAAVIALGVTAVTLETTGEPPRGDVTFVDPAPPYPGADIAPPHASSAPTVHASKLPPSASRFPSPSASHSASPSASPSPLPPTASPTTSKETGRSVSPKPKPTSVTAAPTLRLGDSGPEVEKLQRLLAVQGTFKGKINGKFDRRVQSAVDMFQIDRQVHADARGTYGPATRRALEG